MKYIPESTCMTDPVKQFTMLMKQRRRWINGSWFALNHGKLKLGFMFKYSRNRVLRKKHPIHSLSYSKIVLIYEHS
jgi:cellulose synthase/poly-beta-1,6-N-acetylglucosamine synthase-like glycosyltransferase